MSFIGNTSDGNSYWYNDANKKVGTKYAISSPIAVDAIFARARPDYRLAMTRACIYNAATGALIAVSNAVQMAEYCSIEGYPDSASCTLNGGTWNVMHWYRYDLPAQVNLPAGTYILCLIIGRDPASPGLGAAIIFACTDTTYRNGVRNTDAYTDGPSDPFGTIEETYYRDFCIYATLLATATPLVTTHIPTNVVDVAATLNGEITFTGNENATRRGFEVKLTGAADSTYQEIGMETGDFDEGIFSYAIPLDTLTPNTAYTYRAKATNSQGDGYGDVQNFTTLPAITPTPPTPVITMNPPIAVVGLEIDFDGSDSLSGSRSIVSYDWNFGDGATASGPLVKHTYTAVATSRTVRLTITTLEDPPNNTAYREVAFEVFDTYPITVNVEGTKEPNLPGSYTLYIGQPASFMAADPPLGSQFGFWTLDAETFHQNPLTLYPTLYMHNKTLKPVYITAGSQIMRLGYEKDEDFSYAEDTDDYLTALAKTWTITSKFIGGVPSLVFEPSTSIVRKTFVGSRSLHLGITDSVNGQRNEILHCWDPEYTTEMWLETWIYIPSGFTMRPGDWNACFRAIYERTGMHTSTPTYQCNGATFGPLIDGRSTPTQGQMIFGFTHHNNTETDIALAPGEAREWFLSDLQMSNRVWLEPDPAKRWTVANVLGKWFKIKCKIYRNVEEFEQAYTDNSGAYDSGLTDTRYNNGRVEWYLAFPPDYKEILLWAGDPNFPYYGAPADSENQGWNPNAPIRTIGVTPHVMKQKQITDWQDAYFATGYSNYVPLNAPVPVDLYFDDALLSGTPQVTQYFNLIILPAAEGTAHEMNNKSIFSSGETAMIHAEPTNPADYHLHHWLVKPGSAINFTPIYIDTDLEQTMQDDYTVQPVFAAGPAPITMNVVAGANGTITNGGNIKFEVGPIYDLTALFNPVGNGYYVFDHWELSTAGVIASSYAFSVTDVGAALTAVFVIAQQIYINIIAVNGTTSVGKGNNIRVDVGSPITAMPDDGWKFMRWDIGSPPVFYADTVSIAAALALSGQTLTAVFEELPPDQWVLNVTVNPAGVGTVSPTTSTQNVGVNSPQITASVSNENYSFDHWTLDSGAGPVNVGSANPITVPSPVASTTLLLVAVFISSTPKVTTPWHTFIYNFLHSRTQITAIWEWPVVDAYDDIVVGIRSRRSK